MVFITFNKNRAIISQGNYATQVNSGMCHLMPQRHLPEWRKEDERAFVHCGGSNLNHATTSNRVCLKAVQGVVRPSLYSEFMLMQLTMAGIVLFRPLFDTKCYGVQMPAHPSLSTLANAVVASSGACHCYPEWHNFPVITDNNICKEKQNKTKHVTIKLSKAWV